MKNLLFVTSSASGDNSHSNWLSSEILKELVNANPGLNVLTRDLGKNPLPYLDESSLRAFFSPKESLMQPQRELLKNSLDAIKELEQAGIVLIGVPMYNLGIPSTLKSWIDHVVRAGITFKYTDNGPEGQLKNKKVYLAISSGGVYTQGSMKDFDFTEPYLKAILNLVGMTDITVFRMEGTGVSDFKETAAKEAIKKIGEFNFQAN